MDALRFQHYLNYAPKIVLPVALHKMTKVTSDDMKKMATTAQKLLSPTEPARCTSAQYLDRNGKPILFYFGRRLVRENDRKASTTSIYGIVIRFNSQKNPSVAYADQYKGQSVADIEKVWKEDPNVKLVRDGLNVCI